MPNSNHDECRAELERLGWSVALTDNLGAWNLKAVRAQETWMYYAPELQDVWDAVMQMARRHSLHDPLRSQSVPPPS